MLRLLSPLAFGWTLLAHGCFQPLGVEPDAAQHPHDAEVDAGPPTPAILALRVLDHDGAEWPLDAAPRRPVLELETSRPLANADAVLLFDEVALPRLLEDLRRMPLLVRHRDALRPARIERGPRSIRVQPREPLELGARYVVAVAGWGRAAEDEAPFPPFAATFEVARERAGAVVDGTWPPAGAAGVPPELEVAVVRFDDDVRPRGGVRLVGPGGVAATRASELSCAAFGWPDGACVMLRWEGVLRPLSRYTLEVNDRVQDRGGAPVGPWLASFETGDFGEIGLSFLDVACAPDEVELGRGCMLSDDESVRVRLAVDGPARAFLDSDRGSTREVASRGEIALELRNLRASDHFEADLRLVGLDGSTHTERLALATTPPLAALTISETCADPRGPEPRQEYVELLNYGAVPIELRGITLADRVDRLGSEVQVPVSLAPGGRALLVADAFDPNHPLDPPVPPGVPLVRVGTSLASGGLANAGEPLYLRDAERRRLSTVPSIRAPGPGICLVRTGPPRGRSVGHFAAAPCRPGEP
ncbi:MAG: lamin tail domain-containing protein [Myxococcales bacterium]|nr:lamin tail domain-containing protein [Myxococcales bacterium]